MNNMTPEEINDYKNTVKKLSKIIAKQGAELDGLYVLAEKEVSLLKSALAYADHEIAQPLNQTDEPEAYETFLRLASAALRIVLAEISNRISKKVIETCNLKMMQLEGNQQDGGDFESFE